ncbi:DUF3090 domain-containing protein [Planctomonas sp. JC2975]|uniref:DUF3090 domain-containing protein n=1 Tax=Planctomonas sp. JC2975 TaxID=2729626 RepID=UPI0014765A83|nr:DUF3090 domain-containing protein [Planctomonas sp. JC2975]NNC12144.1 DUF3090 domain-containing protein [Planctomonas sp. JC2975]
MPTVVHDFDWPDRVLIGTIGEPGSRSFYLQVKDGRRVVSVLLEKEQSALLAMHVEQILDELMGAGNPFGIPADPSAELIDRAPLDPVDEQFRTGTIGLGWDPTTAQVVLQLLSEAELDEPTDSDEEVPEEAVVIRMPVGAARAFARGTRAVVAAGRPSCPRCGLPVDPHGHTCPDSTVFGDTP